MAVPTKPSPPPPPLPTLEMLHGQTLVVDVEAWILRPPVSAFPYFMLVAVEAGSFLRGLLLLLLYPLMLLLLGDGARAKAMATVALVGLEEKEVARVGRAVLPKFFLEATAAEGVAAVQAAARVVAVTATFPRVMVDGFLREYVGVDAVVGPEVRSVGGVLAGLMDDEDADEVAAKTLRAVFGDDLEAARKKGAVGLVGPASSGRVHYLLCPYYCKVRPYVRAIDHCLLTIIVLLIHASFTQIIYLDRGKVTYINRPVHVQWDVTVCHIYM